MKRATKKVEVILDYDKIINENHNILFINLISIALKDSHFKLVFYLMFYSLQKQLNISKGPFVYQFSFINFQYLILKSCNLNVCKLATMIFLKY
jgi:hypothetical protein